MAFVTGLMGPYMSPIPINSSLGMALSLAIAFTVTPWLALKLMKPHDCLGEHPHGANSPSRITLAMARGFKGALLPFLESARKRWLLLAGILAAMWLWTGIAYHALFFSEINKAWEEVFVAGVEPPARTSVGVAALPLGATVEIEFSFYRED